MRIATCIIITARLDNPLAWLKETQPDIACLQELKASDDHFPAADLKKAGYAAETLRLFRRRVTSDAIVGSLPPPSAAGARDCDRECRVPRAC